MPSDPEPALACACQRNSSLPATIPSQQGLNARLGEDHPPSEFVLSLGTLAQPRVFFSFLYPFIVTPLLQVTVICIKLSMFKLLCDFYLVWTLNDTELVRRVIPGCRLGKM